MSIRKSIFLILFYVLPTFMVGQELPPIEVYLPEVYGAETQNWSISQAANKYVYIANNKGLLEYNGANWELYPTPNETVMRSVKVIDDRIYTGFYMDFGYWKKNNFGKLEYTSLTKSLKEKLIEDEQFWHIINQGEWVLFQSLNRIYLYNTNTEEISFIDANLTITNIFNVNGSIYYQDVSHGIYKIVKGKPILVIDNPKIINDKIVSISKYQNEIILLTATKGFFTLIDDNISKWEIPSDNLLENTTVYSCTILKDGGFVLGTISKGVMYFDPKGEIVFQINQAKGLSNNTVLSSFEDVEGNIWLGLDKGINCLNIQSAVQSFYDDKGVIGTVYTTIIFDGHLYLGTNQGLFYKKLDETEEFKFVEGTNGQVWNLFTYDNTLFCGHDGGTFLINKGGSKLVCEVGGTWIFRTLPNHPNWLLQGHYTGLSILEKKNDSWGLKHKIEGFDYSARFLESYDDKFWINHEYKGLFQLTLDTNFTRIQTVSKDTLTLKGKNSRIITYKDDFFYVHDKGIFHYNKKEQKFNKTNVISAAFGIQKDNVGRLVKDNKGGLWSFAENELNYIFQSQFSENLDAKKIPIPYTLRKEMIGFENMLHLKADTYLLGTTDGYIVLDISKVHSENHTIILENVEVKQKDTEFEKVNIAQEDPVFRSKLNTISFSYTIPEYDKYLISKFQYKLEGFYEDWSAWTTETSKVFENLPFGDYRFIVRAKIGNDVTTEEMVYKFTIDRPWYFSVFAIVMYSILFLASLFAINKAYKRYYTKQKEKLVEENKKQLELRQLENEREIMKLNNEKLTQDIESKNRELASSTMSIIKKNEILNTIKKELQKSHQDTNGLKNVERIIDRNLNNKDDWRHFEEAFNNVDKDFLKKLKAKHSNLTPHDLRFCTYLRLNLSSKEIAPLLNISVRSVEIKRYRLRKKLELEHSDSLVNYILEI